jgi:hypothetical protein
MTSEAISTASASAEPARCSAPGSRPTIAPSAAVAWARTCSWIAFACGSPVDSKKNIRGA